MFNEEPIPVVVDGLHGFVQMTELCEREGEIYHCGKCDGSVCQYHTEDGDKTIVVDLEGSQPPKMLTLFFDPT